MCVSIDRYADWQWNVNPWAKQDNPQAAISHYLTAGTAPEKPVIRDTAFAWLLYGQRLDVAAQDAYSRCRDRGYRHLFTAVLCACGERQPDLDEAASHLEWQLHSDPLSIADALSAWPGHADHDDDYSVISAMFRLLAGQSHNANAAQLYRACFAARCHEIFRLAQMLFRQFADGRLAHPYLLGQAPSPVNIRDEVPPADQEPRHADAAGGGV